MISPRLVAGLCLSLLPALGCTAEPPAPAAGQDGQAKSEPVDDQKTATDPNELTPEEFNQKREAVDLAFLQQGITFTVYGEESSTERVFPFDLMPRIIPKLNPCLPSSRPA